MKTCDDHSKLTYCSCAACERRILGDSWKEWWETLSPNQQKKIGPPVAGRYEGRPYCGACFPDLHR